MSVGVCVRRGLVGVGRLRGRKRRVYVCVCGGGGGQPGLTKRTTKLLESTK